MQSICGIVLAKERVFLSLACLRRSIPFFREEKEIEITKNDDFGKSLKTNAEIIEAAIVDLEKKYSLSVAKVFLELPPALSEEKEVSEKIIFPRKKKITAGDIDSGKKYIEDKFLEWDQYCLHNIILNYQIEALNFNQAPLGLAAKKVKLAALLIYIKESLYRDISGVFYNLERNFGGLVAHKLSIFSQGFIRPQKNQVVVSIGNYNSYAAIKKENNKIIEKKFSFSIKEIGKELSRQYLITPDLALQLLERYATFKTIPYFKEISVKKENSYLNISTQALGNFLKKCFSDNFQRIINEILGVFKGNCKEVVFSFIGPLANKEGFYGYLKFFLPYTLELPPLRCKSSSFGCAKYGSLKPLEKDHRRKMSLLAKIKKIYHEYF